MKINSIVGLVLLTIILISVRSNAQTAYSLDELDQFTKVERLSDRVLIISNGMTDMDRVTAIATKKGIVMIDAGTNAPRTAKYRKIIEKEFNRNDFVYLINTHSHQDHTFGNRAFKEAVVIGHDKIKEELAKNVKEDYYTKTFTNSIKRWKSQLQSIDKNSNRWKQLRIYLYEGPEILSNIANNFVIPVPDISFSDEIELDMGDVMFKLIYFGPAHTESDILVYVPEEKLLFVGDLFNYPGDINFRFYGKENAVKWNEALNSVLQPGNEIKYVVNAHYSRTMNKDVLTDFSNSMKLFLKGYNEGKEPYNSENIEKIVEESGLKGLKAELNKLQTTENNKYLFLEKALINAAYGLLRDNKLDEAIEVFRFAVVQFPESWNAYDSLAEAYMLAGNKELAIKNYEKSLELNPQNTNAVEQLKILNK